MSWLRSHKLVATFVLAGEVGLPRQHSLQVEEAWVIELLWEAVGSILRMGEACSYCLGLPSHCRNFLVEAFIVHVHLPFLRIGPIHLNEIECTGMRSPS